MSLSLEDRSALRALGWSQFFEQQLDAVSGPLVLGRICRAASGHYAVLTANGAFDATLAGRLLFELTDPERRPAVGDWVGLEQRGEGSLVRIAHLFDRRTAFVRKAAGRKTDAQVVAANVDRVLVVSAVGSDFNVRRLERYLAGIADTGAEPVLVLGKIDLCDDPAPLLAELAAIAFGAPILAVSALRGDGIASLRALSSPGVTLALLGSSGVGKSALVNRLFGADRQAVGAISEHDGRGQHTTTHRELVVLPDGGLVIDTPGMRELEPWAGDDATGAGFADIDALSLECRFRDCRHDGEPGCRVLRAIEAGEIAPARFANYLKLEREMQRQRRQRDARARHEHTQRVRQFARSIRARPKR